MKIIIFRDSKNHWRARIVAANGRTMFVSSEGYQRKRFLLKAIDRLKASIGEAEISEGGK